MRRLAGYDGIGHPSREIRNKELQGHPPTPMPHGHPPLALISIQPDKIVKD